MSSELLRTVLEETRAPEHVRKLLQTHIPSIEEKLAILSYSDLRWLLHAEEHDGGPGALVKSALIEAGYPELKARSVLMQLQRYIPKPAAAPEESKGDDTAARVPSMASPRPVSSLQSRATSPDGETLEETKSRRLQEMAIGGDFTDDQVCGKRSRDDATGTIKPRHNKRPKWSQDDNETPEVAAAYFVMQVIVAELRVLMWPSYLEALSHGYQFTNTHQKPKDWLIHFSQKGQKCLEGRLPPCH